MAAMKSFVSVEIGQGQSSDLVQRVQLHNGTKELEIRSP